MKYRKKPIVVEATQWFKNGDHPEDNCETFDAGNGPYQGEGKVVRYYRHPHVPGVHVCKHCGHTMHHHGWIDTLEGGHTVCPGDWILTGVAGERYPCKPDIFERTYEPYRPGITGGSTITKPRTIAEIRDDDAKWQDLDSYKLYQGRTANQVAADRRLLLLVLRKVLTGDFPLCGQCPTDVDDSGVGSDVEYCEEHCQSNRDGECWERFFEDLVNADTRTTTTGSV